MVFWRSTSTEVKVKFDLSPAYHCASLRVRVPDRGGAKTIFIPNIDLETQRPILQKRNPQTVLPKSRQNLGEGEFSPSCWWISSETQKAFFGGG